MPDSMSKTIPIWCCVLNRAIFPDSAQSHQLYTPPHVVPASEHAQIEKRISAFVAQFLDICKPNLARLRSLISKPMRPLWVTQDSELPENRPEFHDFHPLVLCTASRRVRGAESSGNVYVQGAADDHEAWSHGLTPKLFWEHKSRLLATDEDGLPVLIKSLTGSEERTDAAPICVSPTANLYVSTTQNLDLEAFDVVISCGTEPLLTAHSDCARNKKYLLLKCQDGKRGSRDLRSQLPHLVTFFSTLPSPPGRILVCCKTGKDLSVGVSLTILCLFANQTGAISSTLDARDIDKTFIKKRLAWLTTASANLNPSRKTLLSVHAFLIPEPSDLRQSPCNVSKEQTQCGLVGVEGQRLSPPLTVHAKTSTRDAPSSAVPIALPNAMSTIFNALHSRGSHWRFTRTLTSALSSHPSGTVTGTATFVPFALSSSLLSSEDAKPSFTPNVPDALLYCEEGEFVTTTGLRFQTTRKYVYRLKYDSPDDEAARIAVHFYPDGSSNTKEIGGLFVEMDNLQTSIDGGQTALEASNIEQHLCAEDLYAASWRFDSRMGEGDGIEGTWWEVRYEVKGPKKDYTSCTAYRRT